MSATRVLYYQVLTSNLQMDVFLGALSVPPVNSVLQQGGVFVGSQTPVMVRNTMHLFDDRIEEMDGWYKKLLGNLATNGCHNS